MLDLILLLLLGLLVLWVCVVLYTAWMLSHPPRRTYASAVSRGRPGDPSELDGAREFSKWTLRSRGRELPVWDVPGDDASGPVVVMTHGWGDSRIGALARLGAVLPVASRVVAWDLPGQGESRGWCTLGVREERDLLALIARVRETSGDAPIVLMGWSMGAGLSVVVAGEEGIAGVIAETPYRVPATPARNVLRARRLPHWATLEPALWLLGLLIGKDLRARRFDRAAWSRRVRCPALVLHGDSDAVSPVEDGRKIAAALPRGELVVIGGGGHNDLWTEPGLAAACGAAVRAFLSKLTGGATVGRDNLSTQEPDGGPRNGGRAGGELYDALDQERGEVARAAARDGDDRPDDP